MALLCDYLNMCLKYLNMCLDKYTQCYTQHTYTDISAQTQTNKDIPLKHASSMETSQLFQFKSVQSFSRVRLFATPRTAVCQASLSITNSQSLPKLMSIESVMPSNHLILCRPLLLLPSAFPSIRVFSNDSALHIRWPKYWSLSFNISPSNEHPGLISFRMDWLDLLAVQGTLKSLLQHHSSKASVLRCSAFFIVQLSQLFRMHNTQNEVLFQWVQLNEWTFHL